MAVSVAGERIFTDVGLHFRERKSREPPRAGLGRRRLVVRRGRTCICLVLVSGPLKLMMCECLVSSSVYASILPGGTRGRVWSALPRFFRPPVVRFGCRGGRCGAPRILRLSLHNLFVLRWIWVLGCNCPSLSGPRVLCEFDPFLGLSPRPAVCTPGCSRGQFVGAGLTRWPPCAPVFGFEEGLVLGVRWLGEGHSGRRDKLFEVLARFVNALAGVLVTANTGACAGQSCSRASTRTVV